MDAGAIERQIADRYRGRKWIVTSDAAAATSELVASLEKWGAEGVLVVASFPGIGDLPEAPTIYTQSAGWGMMAGIRAFDAAIAAPEDDLADAVDRFDPEGEAEVIVDAFSTLTEALGRPVFGPRPPRQAALEDKMVVDSLWDAAGVGRAPSAIVDVADAAVTSERLGGPAGTVWVADNKEGWHGAADYVRWVRTAADARDATSWFAEHADRVRVMPFLDGIPCSIHGWVTHDGVAVIRPLEMLVLRRTDRTGFVYGGMASFWDPPPEHREAMRSAARNVGGHLAATVDYIGPFGIDGVLTVDGFLPTELNPRLTAGHVGPAEAAGLLPGAMMRAAYAGDLRIEAAWLESNLVDAGDRNRRGRAMMSFPEPLEDRSIGVCFGADAAERCDDEDRRQATIVSGSGPRGGAVFVRFEPERIPYGLSVAPLAVACFRLARDVWNLEFPPVEPAPDVLAGS